MTSPNSVTIDIREMAGPIAHTHPTYPQTLNRTIYCGREYYFHPSHLEEDPVVMNCQMFTSIAYIATGIIIASLSTQKTLGVCISTIGLFSCVLAKRKFTFPC